MPSGQRQTETQQIVILNPITVLRPLSENIQMICEKEMKKARSFSPPLHTGFCPHSHPTTTLRPEAEKKKQPSTPSCSRRAALRSKTYKITLEPGTSQMYMCMWMCLMYDPCYSVPLAISGEKNGGNARLCFTTHTSGRNTSVYSGVPAACSECRISQISVNNSCNHMWNYQMQTIIKINANVMPSLAV